MDEWIESETMNHHPDWMASQCGSNHGLDGWDGKIVLGDLIGWKIRNLENIFVWGMAHDHAQDVGIEYGVQHGGRN
jgi:hypothetical protein